MQLKKQIFISYNWDNSDVVDEIDRYFTWISLPLIRDKKELNYKSSIKDFMLRIRDTDFVIMIISDSFLKSTNCMYEVLEFIKETKYIDRILQVLLSDANIFSSNGKFSYIDYWNTQYNLLENKITKLDLTEADVLIKELKHIRNIRSNIGAFLDNLTTQNCLSYKEIRKNKFKQLTNIIGLKTIENLDRPTSIKSDIFKFTIEKQNWIVFIGQIDNNLFEIYAGHEGDWGFPDMNKIDTNKPIHLILDQYETSTGRVDLKYYGTDEYIYIVEGINLAFSNSEISQFIRIINRTLYLEST